MTVPRRAAPARAAPAGVASAPGEAAGRRERTADLYRRVACALLTESPGYVRLLLAVADNPRLVALIAGLPEAKRQPALLVAAARYAGIPVRAGPEFCRDTADRWPEVADVILARGAQANEPGRCATLLPLLAALPQPIALLEVGASAGLCLYPDRYSYRYGDLPRLDPAAGPSEVVLRCAVHGQVPVPAALPAVVWRAGIEPSPLRLSDPGDTRWLAALIFPENAERRARLAAAIRIARADPPCLVPGGLGDAVARLAGQAPRDATLVIFHSALLAYLTPAERTALVAAIRELPAVWIANEGPPLLPYLRRAPGPVPAVGPRSTAPGPRSTAAGPAPVPYLLARDGDPVAYAHPHGTSLHWLPPAPRSAKGA